MDAYKIAELKDSILNYLSLHGKEKLLLSGIYNALNLNSANIPEEIVRDYLEDMTQNKEISSLEMSGGRNLFSITDQGKRRLREGGYTNQLEKELKDLKQKQEDDKKYRDKTDLEIENLKASLKNFTYTKWISITAIILSIASLLVSIFF